MMNRCRHVAILLAAAFALAAQIFAGSVPASSAEPPTAIIIFDGSGSMWGKVEDDRASKLVVGREAVRQGLTKVPRDARIGLMSFGHRRGGDCQDTEMIVEPAPLDIERIMTPLEKLNPRGRGPLTKALREAAARLGGPGTSAKIVLIHDNADNCQQDPCAAAGEIKAEHPGVKVDVVSISVPPEEVGTVACLATATGGKHYQVSSAAEANAALTESLGNLTVAPVPAPPKSRQPRSGASTAAAPQGQPGLQLWATLAKGGQPLAIPVHWTVRRAGETGPPLWEGETPAPLLLLASGRYDIEARAGLMVQKTTAEAVEGEPRAHAVVLDAGLLNLASTDATMAALDGSVLTLTRLESSGPGVPKMLNRFAADMPLPAGNYLVSLTRGALRIERPVGIVTGERVSLAGSLTLGTVDLAAVAAKDKPPVDGLTYAVFEDDPDAPQGRREVARSAAPDPHFVLPAGPYVVTAKRGSVEVRERVIVKAGESERRTLVLDAAEMALNVRLAGGRFEGEAPITHRIERLEPQPREVLAASGASPSLELPAGLYRVESRIGLGNVRLEKEVRLKAGETERVAIEAPAGAMRFRLIDKDSGQAVPDTSFEVRDRSGQLAWSGSGQEPRALLLAGRYVLRAEARGLVLERPFDVAAGDERAIELATR
ncbi:MAG: hypothetical protein JSS20_06190 [Proteobacteria bacterium]|nr:hypothetical protein [Pseudomonadota bacterium]